MKISDALVSLAVIGCSHPFGVFGRIDKHYVVGVPHVDDPKFGESTGTSAVLRIPVSPTAQGKMAYIGRLAHQELFQTYPAFDFNVAFASAAVDICGNSDYANPESIWFNVFFGFYEIDAPKALWKRPFGYQSADERATLEPGDIERIGRADWNFFSNHLYGVPLEAIHECCTEVPRTEVKSLGRVVLSGKDGPRWWDDVELRNVTVVSPNRSLVDGGDLVHPRSPHASAPRDIEKLWQRAFGTYPAVESPAVSFTPLKLRARLRMFHDEARVRGQDVYRTFMFGATVREDVEPTRADEFLRVQLDALERVVRRSRLGFEDTTPNDTGREDAWEP